MKRKNIVWFTLILSLIGIGIPALHAGDSASRGASSYGRGAPSRVHAPLYGEVARAQSPCRVSCCERRCARLMGMVYSRGCLCPEVARAIHPVRSYTYLSNHYPPFRYGG